MILTFPTIVGELENRLFGECFFYGNAAGEWRLQAAKFLGVIFSEELFGDLCIICCRADEEAPEPDPGGASANGGAHGGAGLTKMQSFVQMKQVSKVREGRGKP